MDKFKNFFKSFLFIGIIVVLCGTICQLVIFKIWDNAIFQLIINIISSAAITVGVGMIIGFVMDMTKNSSEYISYIQDRLKEIIVSRKFISELSEDKRLEIINFCLMNNNRHSMLDEYATYKAHKINKLCDGHLRSGIDYITTVSKKDGKILLHTSMKYKIYKVNDSYQKVRHIFNNSDGKILSLKITDSKNNTFEVPSEMLETNITEQNQGEEKAYENNFEIPKDFKNEKSLTIKAIVEELGYDHWAFLNWMSIYPTKGITYKIICKDNLIIKEHMIFDDQRGLYYTHAEFNEQNQIITYTISCDEWTDPYTGFSLVIGEP
jgi:hypothetical protein